MEDDVASVVISKNDLVPDVPKVNQTKETLKVAKEMLQDENIQMLIKGVYQKFFSTSPAEKPQQPQDKDQKLQEVLNVIGTIQQNIGKENPTLKDGAEYLVKNIDQVKKMI